MNLNKAIHDYAVQQERLSLTPPVDDDFPDVLAAERKAFLDLRGAMAERPRIVTLCGSTKFRSAFEKAQYDETMAGKIVLTVGCYMHSDQVPISPEQKEALDVLHKRKIDMSDEILVLNQGGYIGESTRSEINHAEATGVQIRYLEPIEDDEDDTPLNTPTPWGIEETETTLWIGPLRASGDGKVASIVTKIDLDPEMTQEARDRAYADAQLIVDAVNVLEGGPE